MKKAKVVSIIVIMAAVVALGIFMGKQMFKLLEADSSTALKQKPGTASSSVKILYSSAQPERAVNAPIVSAELNAKANKPVPNAVKPAKEAEPAASAALSFNPETDKWCAYALLNGVNVRSDSGTSSKALFKVAKGTRGRVLAKKDGWTQLKWDFNKKTGWVRDDLLIQGPAAILTALAAKTDDVAKIDISQLAAIEQKQAVVGGKLAVAVAKPAPVSETVKKHEALKELPKHGVVVPNQASRANIRSGPATSCELISKLPKGLTVEIKSAKKVGKYVWYEIIFNDGKKSGWTRGDNLKF